MFDILNESNNVTALLNKIAKNHNGVYQSKDDYNTIVKHVKPVVDKGLRGLCNYCSWMYEYDIRKEYGNEIISRPVYTKYIFLGNDHGISYKLKSASKKEMEGETVSFNNDEYVIVWKRLSSDEMDGAKKSKIDKVNNELNAVLSKLEKLLLRINDLSDDLQNDIMKNAAESANDSIKFILNNNDTPFNQLDEEIINKIKRLVSFYIE